MMKKIGGYMSTRKVGVKIEENDRVPVLSIVKMRKNSDLGHSPRVIEY
jgi:hypothetical protein